MKKAALLLMYITLFACKNEVKQSETEEQLQEETAQDQTVEAEKDYEDLPILIGKHDVTAIQNPPYSEWFLENYRYMPKPEIFTELQEPLKDIEITVFMGTWCSDSRQHVPALMSTLDIAGYDSQNINLIALSRDKDTPEKLEEGFDIQFVPTIILNRNGKEIGRIVEYPIETIEEDLLDIATGKEYKHAYEE